MMDLQLEPGEFLLSIQPLAQHINFQSICLKFRSSPPKSQIINQIILQVLSQLSQEINDLKQYLAIPYQQHFQYIFISNLGFA